jgi:hypothetical protein
VRRDQAERHLHYEIESHVQLAADGDPALAWILNYSQK